MGVRLARYQYDAATSLVRRRSYGIALPRLKCSRRLTRCLTEDAPEHGALGGGDGADQQGNTQ